MDARPVIAGPRPSLASRPWRLGLFGALYAYQGLVAGFALTALANHFAAAGSSTAEVGRHVAVVGLPWVLQPFLWGPLVDRATPFRMGLRRFWIVLGLAGSGGALALLPALGERPGISVVSAVLLVHSLFASLVDTATDRMIVAHAPADELGLTSACTRGGFVIGNAVGAALFAELLAGSGFQAAALALLALGLLAMLPPLLVREEPTDAFLSLGRRRDAVPARLAGLPARLLAAFRDRAALGLLALCFALDFALALFQVPFGVEMVQGQGWDAAALSRLQAALALAGGTVGALAVGLLADRAGPRRALTGLLAASALAFCVAAILIATGQAARAGPAILGLGSVVPALVYVALLPAVMLASRAPGIASTQFQVFMAAMNLGDVAGAAAADAVGGSFGGLSVAIGVALLFAAAAALCAFRPQTLFGSGGT